MYYYSDLTNNNLFSYNPEKENYYDVKLGKFINNVPSEEVFCKLQPNAQTVFTRTFFILLERWFQNKYSNWNELMEQEIEWEQ